MVSKTKERSKKYLTPLERQNAIALWLQGWGINELAAMHGITHGSMSTLISAERELIAATKCRKREDILEEVRIFRRECWIRHRESCKPQKELRIKTSEIALGDGVNKAAAELVKYPALEKQITRITRQKVGESQWLELVRWAIEFECKLLGYDRVPKTPEDGEEEFRWAGANPDDLDAEMVAYMYKVIAKNRKRARARLAVEGTIAE